ncbi:SDR family NAD(P)-dependent oxidoreductase [Nocardia sp. NPDC006630]|uniref:SDR family NAD(P)-dependent oxidoreductase n=1 Tax=Nocardia sp. NPDC006630 TaxID=3157181 RepID=UPI0033B01674
MTARPLSGHPVMITGAASGIGRGLAQLLSRRGSPVAIADIDETGLKQTAAGLQGPVLLRVLDVRDAGDQLAFAGEVREWLTAPLEAVFNNAGVAVSSSVLDSVPEDDEWLRRIGRGRSREQMAAEFEAVTLTSPEKAAEIICRGVERGKARILVGPDAYVFDALARVSPTHYYDIISMLERRLRTRDKTEANA